jgi:hypothetical protein
MKSILDFICNVINGCGLIVLLIICLIFHGEEKDFLLIKAGEIKVKAFEDGTVVPYFKRIIGRFE